MKLKRVLLVIVLAMGFALCLAPVAPQANATSAIPAPVDDSCSLSPDTAAGSPIPGPKCIPCSANHPCVNPLTVCTYSGNSTHGCCLGYAGQD